MKWKKEVIVEKNQKQYKLRYQGMYTNVQLEDSYIVKAIEDGICDDNKLVQIVIKQENFTEVMANFRLAQFLLDYVEYISNDVGHMIIEP